MKMIAENWQTLRNALPDNVLLLAVSKYHTVDDIREAYQAGCRDFGESRVQELKVKQAVLPDDIRWHFIGHLQTNKVRDLLRLRPYLIHSVDSEHLLRAIDAEAAKQDIVQDVLLELHVAKEETKTGFSPDELTRLLNNQINAQIVNDKIVNDKIVNPLHVRVKGLMGMSTNTDDENEIRRCFRTLHETFIGMQQTAAHHHVSWLFPTELSMGMSDDYTIALTEGTTIVRIGSAIFA